MKDLEFLPQRCLDELESQAQNRRNSVWAVAMMVALVMLYLTNDARLRSASASLASYQSDMEIHQQQQETLNLHRGRVQRLSQRLAVIGRIDDHAPLDRVIVEIAGALSESMALRDLEVSSTTDTQNSLSTSEVTIERELDRLVTHIMLRGVASSDMDVGIFYGRLTASPLFEGVTLQFSRRVIESEREMRVFELTMNVVPIVYRDEDKDR